MEGGGWFSSKHTSSTTMTETSTAYYFTRGHGHSYHRTGQLHVQPTALRVLRAESKGAGEGGRHIHIYIYIYNSDSLYKVGEEKREGGTLLGHHNRQCGLSPHPTDPQPCPPGRLGWLTSHWSMCSWGWRNTESGADSWHPGPPPWLHSGPPAARVGSSMPPWSTPPELC